jgi:hypothetical protein
MNSCRPVPSRGPSPLAFFLLFLAFCGTVVPVFAQHPSVRADSGSPSTALAADALNPGGAGSASAPAAAKTQPAAAPRPALLPTVSIIPRVQVQVEVDARRQTLASGPGALYHFTSAEVLSSAGTWGDFTRYLQLFPGVVWNTDMSNDIMVRGGSPEENLYVVDGIEVPNINHIALEGTTGGFTSMLDSSTLGSVDLKAGEYDARYSSRLSSLVDIHTLAGGRAPAPGIDARRSGEVDAGISGVGGFLSQPFGKNGNLLLSAHRSILNLATDDIGINGVPIYTNGLAHLEASPTSRDHISALSLSGADSIDITPQPCDPGVTSLVQTQYGGMRSTDGLVWQHTHTPRMLSTVTASYSAQSQLIGQQLQEPFEGGTGACWNHPYQTSPLYREQTRDGIATLGYGLEFSAGAWLFSFGETGRLVKSGYAVAQPLGQQSPFNSNPAWTDADNFARNLVTGQTGSYAQATAQLGARWTVIAGVREETFAIAGAHAFDPRASVGLRIAARQTLHVSFEQSAQLPPMIDLLSYAQNARLLPVGMRQFAAGAGLWISGSVTASIEAYAKRYFNEPESTEYPSLMLANMVDTLGQQFVWLPLKSGGRGRSQGIELLLRAHRGDRIELLSSASYSKTLYAAADGILRPGNFDFPLVVNGMATIELPGKLFAAFRDTYAGGRPYTPFDIAASEQQARGIYNLELVNALRGPAYNRVDADFHRAFRVRGGLLNIYGGVENAFNRPNFLGYAWESECRAPYGAICGESINAVPGVPEYKVTQMPRFPSAGLRLAF